MENEVCTAIGTSNKALVLYWGKRDFDLNLPLNSSVSITLDETLNTRTSIMFSPKFSKDAMYLDGEYHELSAHPERKMSILHATLNELRKRSAIKSHALIVTQNSFPKSVGLASSASGAVTFVYAASKALGVDMDEMEMSKMVRNISGSGSRSVFGGFSAWKKGTRSDGEDSYAYPIADQNHWPEFIDVIGMVSAVKKKISTDEGHMITTKTSPLLKHRCTQAEVDTETMSNAILKRDFHTVAYTTMRDSNCMHATMLDSWPPISYLTDKSKEVMEKVHALNDSEGKTVAGYTFDAGPNPHIMTTRKYEHKVVSILDEVLGEGKHYVAGQGSGPRLLKDSDSLIDLDKLKPR
ncbi:MAG TPA: diphosphomevalonate decarboxylase [Candidatus Acidoferrales bacterium]|nr:diphosphomevalonate decarboxylase [Candidatus Acidoferrales bacterium]